jgi:RNA polymerase sigma factor for flagellar operon FliA
MQPDQITRLMGVAERYAKNLARRYSQWSRRDDLIQEAKTACLEACNRYDAARDISETQTYVKTRIWGSLIDYMRDEHIFSRDRDGVGVADKMSFKVHLALEDTFGLGLPPHDAEAIDAKTDILKALRKLPKRDKVVLHDLYWEELTMREIALKLGLTEGRISQIHKAALESLKACMMPKAA